MYEVFVIGKPKQKAKWQTTPSIRVCTDTQVSEHRIKYAIRYWQNYGYEFDGITMDDSPNCKNPNYGEILITLPETGFSDSHMASTRLLTHRERGDIIKVKIHILPKYANKKRVLEHELGHALGWAHYPLKLHIMHPTWQLC